MTTRDKWFIGIAAILMVCLCGAMNVYSRWEFAQRMVLHDSTDAECAAFSAAEGCLYPSAQMVTDFGYGEARYSAVTNFEAAIKTKDIERIGWCIRLGEYPKELRLAAYPVGTDRMGIEGNASQKIARTAVVGVWEYACVTYNVDTAAPGLDAKMEAYLMELTGSDSLQ